MADTPGDSRTRACEAVRAHELMLNEAVSRFEHARRAPLITLNGGAVVAFLTLLGALVGKDSGKHPNLWLSALAVGAWVVGLLAAALATSAATDQQRAISSAHRLLREDLEGALIAEAAVTTILTGPAPTMKWPSSVAWIPNARNPAAGIREWWTGEPSQKPSTHTSDDLPNDRSEGGQGESDQVRDRRRERSDLRKIACIYAKRLRARWWLSLAMFVTGGVLALAAIVSGAPVSNPTRNAATTIQTAQCSTAPTPAPRTVRSRPAGGVPEELEGRQRLRLADDRPRGLCR